MSRAYVFLDRDGTLVVDPGFVHRLEHYALLPGVTQGLIALRDAGLRLAIVTNQSGIGRGYYTNADFERFQERLLADLAARGIEIDATFHCPHAPDDGCDCRKPRTGLLERARRELDADLARSWVVGDAPSDVELACRAGCRSVRVVGTAARPDLDAPDAPRPTRWARDLIEAAARILEPDRTER